MERAPTVLVVDDDERLLRSLVRLFKRAGWDVTSAVDGRDALVRLAESAPDVLVTDMRMPRLDGLGLLEKLRGELGLTLPAIVLSGYHDHTVEKLRALGVVAVFAKPMPARERIAAAQQAVGEVG